MYIIYEYCEIHLKHVQYVGLKVFFQTKTPSKLNIKNANYYSHSI